MKIEQQEISTKLKISVNYLVNLSERNTTQTKVKEQDKSSRLDFNSDEEIRYNDFESLILAQDERWRRA